MAMHSQHPAVHKVYFLPCITDNHSVLNTWFTNINSGGALCCFFPEIPHWLQVGEEMETGQGELANKPLLFSSHMKEKAIKNKEPGPTSLETAGRAHKWIQLVLCQRQLAHGHICFRNKAPDVACQLPKLPSHPLAKPENALRPHGALVSELLNHSRICIIMGCQWVIFQLSVPVEALQEKIWSFLAAKSVLQAKHKMTNRHICSKISQVDSQAPMMLIFLVPPRKQHLSNQGGSLEGKLEGTWEGLSQLSTVLETDCSSAKCHKEVFIIIQQGILHWCVETLGWEGSEAEIKNRDGRSSKMSWGP